MLYLMMNKTAKAGLVKVGFSDGTANLKSRRKAYYSYNPAAIMRSTCAGGRDMENACRVLLVEAGGERIKGTEWFVIPMSLFDELYEKGMGYFRTKHKPIHFPEEFY